jgi:hypothetical protein
MIDRIRRWLNDRRLRKFLSSTTHGWLLFQKGREYELKELGYDEALDCYFIQDEDGEELYFEDELGRMGSLEGVPIGLASSQGRPIVDVQDAEHATAFDEKSTDKKPLQDEDVVTVKQMRDSLQVARLELDHAYVEVINPFIDKERQTDIVDLRPTFQLFRRSARPDTPRKAAKNAIEAERAKSGPDLGQIGYITTIFSAFFLGAIVTEFIAGGSSGGGVALPVMLEVWGV